MLGIVDDAPPLAELLARHRGQLVRFLSREAGGLMRFEDAEDLAQGVQMHALRVEDRFTYQGEPQFIGWIHAVARRYIADRNAYWKALKRNAGTMLRLTFGASSQPGGANAFARARASPCTVSPPPRAASCWIRPSAAPASI